MSTRTYDSAHACRRIAAVTPQHLHSDEWSPHPLSDPPAEEKKVLAEDKASEIEEQNKVIAVEKKDAESSLAEALPALEAARFALQDLDKSDVTEIRSAPQPC